MDEEVILNQKLLKWIFDVVESMIENTIEDSPEKISTFIAVNNMLNQLDVDVSKESICDLIGESLVDAIFTEIKSNM